MLGADLTANQLQNHLHHLSATVEQRLVAVLDRARSVTAEASESASKLVGRVAREIVGLQKTILTELATGELRHETLTTMLKLEIEALRVLDEVDLVLSQKANEQAAEDPQSRSFQSSQFGNDTMLPPPWEADQENGASLSYATSKFDNPRYSIAASVHPIDVHAPGTALDSVRRAFENASERVAVSSNFPTAGTVSGITPRQSIPNAPNTSRAVAIRRPSNAAIVTAPNIAPQTAPATAYTLTMRSTAVFAGLLTCAILAKMLLGGATDSNTLTEADLAATRTDRLAGKTASGSDIPSLRSPNRNGVSVARTNESGTQTRTVPVGPVIRHPSGGEILTPTSFVPVIATVTEVPAAQEAVDNIMEKYPNILGSVTRADIEPIESPDGAVWYRTYLLPALTRTRAKDMCRRLREAGHRACWVKVHGL
jgi:hypothetical protein